MSRGCHLAIAILMAHAASFGQPAPDRPAPMDQTRTVYILGPDDQLKIWSLGVEEITDKPIRIDPSGDLDLPVVGKIRAAGLTVEQLKQDLIRRFSRSVRTPQVSVEIVDFGSQTVSVMGAVVHPGIHQLRGRKTLIEVLSLAGGLRPDAGSTIHVSREISRGPIPLPSATPTASGDFTVADVSVKELLTGLSPSSNFLILSRDVVTVPLTESVFVLGAVRKPGEVMLKDRTTISVLQALASAEGFGPTPAPQNAKIVRLATDRAERTEIPVDLKKIQAGQAEDVAMRARDILVVPPSGPKKAGARAMEAAIQAATGIAIWRRP